MIPHYYVAHSPDPRPVLTFKQVSQFSPGQGLASSPCEDDKDDAARCFAAAANDHRNMNMPFYTRAPWNIEDLGDINGSGPTIRGSACVNYAYLYPLIHAAYRPLQVAYALHLHGQIPHKFTSKVYGSYVPPICAPGPQAECNPRWGIFTYTLQSS